MVIFKLRIFRSCRTKDTSTPPEEPAPAPPSQRHKVPNIDLTCTTSPPPSKQPPHRTSSLKTHVCSFFRCNSNSGNHSASKDHQSHVIVDSPRPKIYNSSAISGVISDQFTTKYTVVEQQKPEIISSSSRSFSTNYSPTVKKKKRRLRSRHRGRSDGGGGVSPEWGSPARLSVFKACEVEGKVKESFAVVKRSENPYEDFKKSMMEMIVEKEMVEESDLTQLLQCFLSLNSRYHHGVIMEAFSDTMFLHQYRTFGF